MFLSLPSRRRVLLLASIAFMPLVPPAFLRSQTCPAASPHNPTSAETAYANSDFATAESLYAQALAQNPLDAALSAALVRTLIHERKLAQAAEQANADVSDHPDSADALAALAEVQLRQGQPWLASETLDKAAKADPCNAQVHLVRSRVERLDSMYATERAEIQKAYAIDPADPDILQAWNSIISAAQEIEGTEKSLAAMKDLDEPTREKAEASVRSLLPLLSENSQTCKGPPSAPSAELPLLPSKQDGKHLDGYKLEAQVGKSNLKLTLDTAASGLFITRAEADENGFHQSPDDPAGTVRVDSVHIGPLEFRDCMVGVSDSPFAGKEDGFISTDIFASYLIGINPRDGKMTLEALPPQPGPLPGDRAGSPDLAGYTPVYHRRQYLLVPANLDSKSRRLFVLDTGMRYSAMTPAVAHSLSHLKMNFTNPVPSATGPPIQVYRDSFDFEFASLSLRHQDRVVEFDPSAIENNTGFEIGGLLGFDMLHLLDLHLDYRDGLVKFESINTEAAPAAEKGMEIAAAPAGAVSAPAGESCPHLADQDFPIKSTLDARVRGTLDSAHLKPGKEIWVTVLQGYALPECTLNQDATLYGHVAASSSSKNPEAAELALIFDHADCAGQGKRPLALQLIGLVGPPGAASGMHEAAPTEVAGGARSISNMTAATDGYDPALRVDNLPKTVRPGLIVDIPKLNLDPTGGPGCSAKITSNSRSVELATGARLIFAVTGPPELK
jgi:tetratricopeptide (TPR) repeat protein